ncbi:hypothetical protein ACJJTC_011052 [Scirpophaga incertulas]
MHCPRVQFEATEPESYKRLITDSAISRGGVLEAEGIVEVKFKQRDILKTMHRMDPELMRLTARITELKEQIKDISKNLDRRGSIDEVVIKTDAGNHGNIDERLYQL